MQTRSRYGSASQTAGRKEEESKDEECSHYEAYQLALTATRVSVGGTSCSFLPSTVAELCFRRSYLALNWIEGYLQWKVSLYSQTDVPVVVCPHQWREEQVDPYAAVHPRKVSCSQNFHCKLVLNCWIVVVAEASWASRSFFPCFDQGHTNLFDFQYSIIGFYSLK